MQPLHGWTELKVKVKVKVYRSPPELMINANHKLVMKYHATLINLERSVRNCNCVPAATNGQHIIAC